MFENYKSVTLLKYMRAISKNPVMQQDLMTLSEKQIKQNQVKINLFALFVKLYELTRYYRKLVKYGDGKSTLYRA